MTRSERIENTERYASRVSTWRNWAGQETARSRWVVVDSQENTNWKSFYLSHGYMPIAPYMVHDASLTWTNGQVSEVLSAPYPTGSLAVSSDHGLPGYAALGGARTLSLDHPAIVSLRNETILQLNTKVLDLQANLAETGFELGKTAAMIGKRAQQIANAMRAVKRGRFQYAASILSHSALPQGVRVDKGFASNWLEYRYGWMPIYLTMYGSMKAVYDAMHRADIRILNSRISRELTPDLLTCNSDGGSFGDTTTDAVLRYTLEQKRKLHCQAGYIVEITNPTIAAMTSLGLTNPAALAWELLPLSFVADWFVSIGDCIGQLSMMQGKRFGIGYISMTEEYSLCTRSGKGVIGVENLTPYRKGRQVVVTPATVSRRDKHFTRQVLSQPEYVMPQFRYGLTNKRLADAISLISVLSH